MKNNTNYERAGKILASARNHAGLSQYETAKRLGIAPRTIQNWESGTTSPSFPDVLDFFNAIGVNPIAYLEAYVHPYIWESISKKESDEPARDLLHTVIDDLAIREVRDLLYILRGNHGSSAYAVLQEIVANLHTTIDSRHIVAEVIRFNFEREQAKDELVCPENIMPDMDAFIAAIDKGKEAAKNRRPGYVIKG